MTRFDEEPRAARARGTARGIVAGQPMIFIATILLASVFLLAASCALLICQGARYELGKAVEAVQISAYLRPQLTRQEAEGLRGRIEEIPMVSRATLSTREEALTALAGSGVIPSPANANVLPDVWNVQLRGMSADGDRTMAGRIEAVRRSLSSLEAVESVKFDQRWVHVLDDWSALMANVFAAAIWAICGTLAIVIAGVHLLGGRSYAAFPGMASDPSVPSSRQVLATIGFISGLVSLSILAFVFYLVTIFFPGVGSLVQLIVASAGRSGVILVVGAAAMALFLACAATSLGGQRR